MAINFPRLRRQNVMGYGEQDLGPISPFQGLPDQIVEPDATTDPSFNENDFIAQRMRQLYNPHNEASDRLNQMLDQFPQRQQPGNLRKIGASMVGLRNVGKKNTGAAELLATQQMQDKFMDPGYYRRVEDFKTRAEPTLKAAEIERQGNVNERGFANQILSQELNYRKQDEVERKNRETQRLAAERNRLYQMKASMPDWDWNLNGPTIVMKNKKTGEIRQTQIETGKMDEMDKINLQGEWGVKRAEAQGEAAVNLENTRQPHRIETTEAAGEEARRTKQTPGASSANALELSRQKLALAQNLRDTMPGARSWIRISPSGQVEVLPTTIMTSVKDQKIRADIIKRLYGMPPKPVPAQAPDNNLKINLPGQGSITQPQGVPVGRVRVIDRDGNVGTIPESQLQQALSQGYKRVQ